MTIDKHLSILFISSIAILFTACQPKEEPKVEEFREFIVEVEHSIKDQEIKNWSEVEQEFHQQWDQIEESTESLNEQATEEIDSLRQKFEELGTEWKQANREAQQALSTSITELDTFLTQSREEVSDVTGEVLEYMTNSFHERRNEVEKAAQQANQNVDTLLTEMDARFDAMVTAWKEEATN